MVQLVRLVRPILLRALSHAAAGLFPAEPAPLSPYLSRRLADDVFATLASVVPDQLAEALLEHHEGGGMSIDSRLAKLHEIDAALFAAECAEETAVRELRPAPAPCWRGARTATPRSAPDRELLGDDYDDEPEPAEAAGTTRRTSKLKTDSLRVDIADEMRRATGAPPAAEQQPAATAGSSLTPAEKQQIVADERRRCLEVLSLCEMSGRSDLASDMILGGKPVGDVARALERARPAARRPGRA